MHKAFSWSRYAVLVILVGLLSTLTLSAQDDTSLLELTKSIEGDPTEIESGDFFTYVIQYRCVGIVQDCRDVSISDVLPPELSWDDDDVTLFGTIHTVGQTYDPDTGLATWNFIDPLPAGSTGELRLRVRFPPGVTPDETIATNSATATATDPDDPNNTISEDSNPISITADAEFTLQPEKVVLSGGAVDNETTYEVRICRPADDSGGLLALEDVTMVDTLPDGATFVSANGGGVYDAGPPQTVTWDIDEVPVTGDRCTRRTVTVRYDIDDGFAVGDSITNNVSVTGTPVGQTPVTLSSDVVHILDAPEPDSQFFKRANTEEAVPGDVLRYGFYAANTGSSPLDVYTITDTILPQVNVVTLHTGNGVSAAVPLVMRYQTNLNPVYVDVPGSPFDNPADIPVATLGLAAGEYITALEWDFTAVNPVPVGWRSTFFFNNRFGFSAQVLSPDRNGVPVVAGQILNNVGQNDFGYQGNNDSLTNEHNVLITDLTTQPRVDKSVNTQDSVDPGDTVTFTVEVGNAGNATGNLVNPVIADLLDPNIIYVDWRYDPNGTNAPEPTLERIDNYNGTGQTLLRWRWEGATAYTFTAGEFVTITYDVDIAPTAEPGTDSITNNAFIAGWDASIPRVSCPTFVQDTNDLDGDGVITEEICASDTVGLDVNSQAVMESAKWVRGELDTDWVRFPDIGLTSPGGTFEYRLDLRNAGNVPMTDIVIIEILPHVGDTGVIDPDARETAWEPQLVGNVDVSTSGVTVFYSTAYDPCRPAVVPSGPAGCEAPNWTTVPPADITTVRSLRFALCCTIEPGDVFEIILPMRAPDTAQPGQTAWNSFGYSSTRDDTGDPLLPAEPFKVGITTYALPLQGSKAAIEYNEGESFLTYEMVWINNQNVFGVDARIFDPIPVGTSYIPGTLSCEARGTSTQLSCLYDPVTNQISWEGNVGADPGAVDADSADNEVVIRFRLRVGANVDEVLNQAQSTIDADVDGSFDDEIPQVSDSVSNPTVWTRDDPTGDIQQPISTSEQSRTAAIEQVSLTKSVSPPFAAPGETVTWVMSVTNPSELALSNIVVTDVIPAGLTVTSATSSSGQVSISGDVVTFTQGVLSPSETVIITVNTQYDVASGSTGFIITNNATLSIDGEVTERSSASFLQITALPQTGESPYSAPRALLLAMLQGVVLALCAWGVMRFASRRKTSRVVS